jgi:hypothetical protein
MIYLRTNNILAIEFNREGQVLSGIIHDTTIKQPFLLYFHMRFLNIEEKIQIN